MRDFSTCKRIVVKIGTNLLSKNQAVDTEYLRDIAQQIAGLHEMGKQILIVTSGAIGMGAGELGITEKVKSIPMRQACASIGQPLLMEEYKKIFREFKIKIAQILLTREVLTQKASNTNLAHSVEQLLALKVIPVFNENDSISTEEIGNAFGDNDRLSALIASKMHADMLILLTDIDALYDKNPKEFSGAKRVHHVERVTQDILDYAGGAGSTFSTGGMKTKLRAAQITNANGIPMVLAHGKEQNILARVITGEEIGTLFLHEKKHGHK